MIMGGKQGAALVDFVNVQLLPRNGKPVKGYAPANLIENDKGFWPA